MPAIRLATRLVVLTALAAVLAGALPGTAAAADPSGVQSKIEGCKATAGTTLPNGSGQFVCPNANYTTGNLGKFWNELDLVPFRITLDAGNSAPATQTYSLAAMLDSEDGTPDRPGYDVISALTLNTALSAASCGAASDTGQQTGANLSGGIDQSIYRLFTVTQLQNTKCVYDYYGRLALGAHLFPGAALHANLAEEDFRGGSDVSIPVNEVAPQELSKDMSATRGSDHAWSITKGAQPEHVDFTNTCADPTTLNAQVGVTITWTKLPATPSGDVTVITHVYAENPAARTINVKVSDAIRSGTTVLETINNGVDGTDVPANTTLLVLTHSLTVPATTTNLNDVATATYTDVVTGVPIPGSTTATASATVQNTGLVTNTSAVITDSESIDGNFLFSADSFLPANIGSFDNGYAGAQTAGTVDWTSVSQTDSGSVTFSKTVYVPATSSGSGTLSDVATILGSNGFTTDADASVALSAAREATISIVKNIPDVLQGGETASFTFDIVDAQDNVVETRTLSFAAGDTQRSVDVSGLTPGAYSVVERSTAGWADQDPFPVDVTTACTAAAEFTNGFANATAEAHKVTQPGGEEAGWEMTLTGPGTPQGQPETATTDANGDATFTTDLVEGDYTITETNQAGWTLVGSSGNCSFTVDYPADADQSFSCTFTNRRPAGAAAVKITQPAGAEEGWTMTLNGPGAGANGEAVQTDSNGNASFTTDLVEGDYTITETNQSGWDALTPTGDCSFTVDYPADADRTFTCTFTNRRPAGAAAVKITQPAGAEEGWTMTLNGPGAGANGEAVQTDSNGNASFTTDLVEGDYTITETNQSGWDALTPTGDCSFTVDYPADADRTFTCTFTNRRPAGAAAVKITQPAGAEEGWTMTLNGPGAGANGEAVQTDSNGNASFTTDLVEGDYTITETNQSGWDALTPTGDCSFTVDYPADADRTFTCTFTNVMRPAGAAAVKITQPAGSQEGWTMTLNGPGAGANGEAVQTDAGGNATFSTDLVEGDYTITETNQAGWTALTPTGDCSFTVEYPADADRTFTCTFTNRRPAHAAAVKITQPAGLQAGWTMKLAGPGAGANGESVQTDASGNVSFTTALQAGPYTITETNQTGWDAQAPTGDCAFTVSYPADAGRTFTCTFTNIKRANLVVQKTVNGGSDLGGMSFSFQLRSGASPTSVGSTLESKTLNAANNPLAFSTSLTPGATYQLCEALPGIGWMTSLFDNGVGFTPNVVNDPWADNSLICHDFTAGAGQTLTITVDNTPPPGGLALTIGYWKNHASCASNNGKQKQALDITLASFPIAGGQSTRGVFVGSLYVDTCLEAVRLLDKSTVNNGKKMASDPAYNLAAQLMAVELNIRGGAGPCGYLLAHRAEAQALLAKYGFNGTSSYTSGASKMTAVDQARANYLASQLDDWNNNTLC